MLDSQSEVGSRGGDLSSVYLSSNGGGVQTLDSHSVDDVVEQLAADRLKYPRSRLVVAVSDLNEDAAVQQGEQVAFQHVGNVPIIFAKLNVVEPFNEISAAHALSTRLSDSVLYPGGTVFVITVDPHVGTNGDGGKNVLDARVAVRYADGTILIGPNKPYMRMGESFPERGKIVEVVELSKEKLIDLGFTTKKASDVFDGLSCFAPAASAVTSGVDLKYLGESLPVDVVPPLEIPEGTILDIEDRYGNIRVEFNCAAFPYGSQVSVKNESGDLICVVDRTASFQGQKGRHVLVDGSKKCLQHEGQAAYIASVLGNFAKEVGGNLKVGERIVLSLATPEEIGVWHCRKAFEALGEGLKGAVGDLRNVVIGQVEKALGRFFIPRK